MGSHVFISYSRTDRAYADKLAAHLRGTGLEVWYDFELVTGDRFDRVIKEKIDTCAAFVVVMTPEADESHWVHVEVTHALSRRKPILPLLLRGEVFLVLNTIEFDDVFGGRLPSERFMAALRRYVRAPATPPPFVSTDTSPFESMVEGMIVTPWYLAIDVSATVDGIALGAVVPEATEAVVSNPLLSDTVRLAVIEFAHDARLVRQLSDPCTWEDTPRLRYRPSPRRYGPALRLLGTTMRSDLNALRAVGACVYRSLAMIFTSGDAVDDWTRDLAECVGDFPGTSTSRWYPIVIPAALSRGVSPSLISKLVHPRGLSRALTLDAAGVNRVVTQAGQIVGMSIDDILEDVPDRASIVLPNISGPDYI